jgi:polyferredoxin
MWLCPFKTVTEFPAVRSVQSALQFVVFVVLFAGLVVVLPFLTKKRTQCGFFCPFGAFQSIFNKINLFEIRINRDKCVDCTLCQTACPTVALSTESIREGKTLLNCMKCGACVDACKKDAAVWHLKGTEVGVKPERARLLFLYGTWGLATMFGGSILANSLATALHLMHWN